MFLEKIEIQGFKSFADRTILEFPRPSNNHQTITIIVGPNGSGKSNIVDAIKWVFGEQSIKNIRGKKAEDVIFSGSTQKSRLGFAQVSLYLNNEDGQAPIDFSELIITRRLYRDGVSEYLLNKNPVRLFDVQLLLAKAHFGQKSFSIIGQGKIDSVLLATPLERKDFFDEAVGVKEHQIKRHQALNKLERTEENLHQAKILLKEVEPQLRSLTRQVKKLEKREKIQAQLKDYQHAYYHRLWKNYTGIEKEQKSQIDKIQTELDELQTSLIDKRVELDALEKAESRGEIFTDLQRKLQAKNQEKNMLLREMTIIKGRLEVDLEQQGQLNLAWLYRKEEDITQSITDAQKEITNLKQEHKTILQDQKTKQQELEDIKNKIETHTKSIDNLKTQLKHDSTKGPLTILSHRLKDLYVQFQKFSKKITRVTTENLVSLQDEAESLQAQLNELSNYITDEIDGTQKEEEVKISESQELWDLQQKLTSLIEKSDKLLPQITDFRVKAQVTQEQLRLKQADHAKLQQELNKITNDLSNQKATREGKVDTKKIEAQQESLNKDIQALENETAKLQEKINAFNEQEDAKQSRVFKLEREYQEIQQQINRLQQKQHGSQVELARTETKLEELENTIKKELGDPTLVHNRPDETQTDMDTLPTQHLFSQIEKFKYQLELIGGIDPETVEEYKQVKERHDFLSTQTQDLEKAIDHIEAVIQELDKTIVKQFDKAFSQINKEFEKYFQILFGGGRAKLIKILPDSEDEKPQIQPTDGEITREMSTEEQMQEINTISSQEDEIKQRSKKYRRSDIKGIEIYASPAGKKLSSISMLSGGERSLTSLALIAAIVHHNPPPFILMDEVDAALDEANSQRMAKVLENLRKMTQFIIITHNRTIMNISDTIYGVTMKNDGVSRLLSIKLEEIDEHAARL